MIIYVDTNVLISSVLKQEKFHDEAKRLLEVPDLTFTTGIITLLEFATVMGQLHQSKQIDVIQDLQEKLSALDHPKQVKFLIEYSFARFPVKILPVTSVEKLTFREDEHSIDSNFSLAYRLAPRLPLRACDLLQIAAALKIRLYTKYAVQYFLTNDGKMLGQSALIRQIAGFITISTTEMLTLLKINPQKEDGAK
jgi:predicted nucleic acid-binding protein